MLTVADLMTVRPVTVAPDTLVSNVAELMQREGYRQLPVVENGELVGIITDRDIRMVQRDGHFETATAESCMTPNPITVTSDTPAYRAATMLTVYKFGALPVVDQHSLIGIITVSDFLDYFVVQPGI
jgi:CBS domain-containing protein